MQRILASNIKLKTMSACSRVSSTFSRCAIRFQDVPRRLKSGEQWLERQMSDPYVEKAKFSNYRCRSAFKLLEMNEKAKFLVQGQTVVDLGAAPGSWTQVAVQLTNSDGAEKNKPKGTVLSIDKQYIFPIEDDGNNRAPWDTHQDKIKRMTKTAIPLRGTSTSMGVAAKACFDFGATVMGNMDFSTIGAHDQVVSHLAGKQVDVVVSDMAPSATGVRSLDKDRIVSLCYMALRFAAQVSKIDGTLLIKVWDGKEVPVLESDLGRFYKNIKIMKPNASRSDSTEKFLLARGFKGLLKREE